MAMHDPKPWYSSVILYLFQQPPPRGSNVHLAPPPPLMMAPQQRSSAGSLPHNLMMAHNSLLRGEWKINENSYLILVPRHMENLRRVTQ